jgi:4-hydroxythreonine-4-phosphate dehydrogenase
MSLIAITTGDSDGIGLEVTLKSLLQIGPQKKSNFIIYRSLKKNVLFKKFDSKFDRITFSNWTEAHYFISSVKLAPNMIIDIANDLNPAFWVEEAARLAHLGIFSSLVTGPISKETVLASGLKDMGHTGILKRVTGCKEVSMAFVGIHFNVVLATDHISLNRVPQDFNKKSLQIALKNSLALVRKLNPKANRDRSKNAFYKKICVLGLNPHAGEKGLLGTTEINWLFAFCKKNKVFGPVSPDAAFLKQNWDKYSVFIAAYHDQGLIPFKLVHGQDSGFQITLGIPFLRTSVDHGTAKDIYGKNIANPASMKEAIQYNLRQS